MLSNILEATKNFCIHQIREEFEIINDISKKRTIIAYIDIISNDETTFRVHLASDFGFMQRVALLFLEEDESDEETLSDMLLESINLIVGSAKVIAQDSDKAFTIKTPKFEKIGEFDIAYDDYGILKIGEDELLISIKEI